MPKKREKLYDEMHDIKKKYEKMWLADDSELDYNGYKKMVEKETNPLVNKFIKEFFDWQNKWLKQNKIDDQEMLKTFNCGVGFCLVIDPKNLKTISKYFTKEFKPYVIGKITSGKNKVTLNGKIDWS